MSAQSTNARVSRDDHPSAALIERKACAGAARAPVESAATSTGASHPKRHAMFVARTRSLALLGALLLLHMALTLPRHHACAGRDCSEPLAGPVEKAGRALPRQLLLQTNAAVASGGGGGLPGPLLEEPPQLPAAHPNQTAEQVLQALAQGKAPFRPRPGVMCLVSAARRPPPGTQRISGR